MYILISLLWTSRILRRSCILKAGCKIPPEPTPFVLLRVFLIDVESFALDKLNYGCTLTIGCEAWKIYAVEVVVYLGVFTPPIALYAESSAWKVYLYVLPNFVSG